MTKKESLPPPPSITRQKVQLTLISAMLQQSVPGLSSSVTTATPIDTPPIQRVSKKTAVDQLRDLLFTEREKIRKASAAAIDSTNKPACAPLRKIFPLASIQIPQTLATDLFGSTLKTCPDIRNRAYLSQFFTFAGLGALTHFPAERLVGLIDDVSDWVHSSVALHFELYSLQELEEPNNRKFHLVLAGRISQE